MNNQNVFFVNRYSSISCLKDQSIATCGDVTRLLLMFENLRLTPYRNENVAALELQYHVTTVCNIKFWRERDDNI